MSELPAAKKSRVTKGYQPDWKKQWPWISGGPGAEDKPENGVFCRLCMVHQKNNPILSRTGGKFVTAGFDAWNRATQKLGGHDTSDMHKDSMQKAMHEAADPPDYRLVEPGDTRWLSNHLAFQSVIRDLRCLVKFPSLVLLWFYARILSEPLCAVAYHRRPPRRLRFRRAQFFR
eukprot:Hpha_TRINITY_DN16864_c0_g1::TRINITY_DN16864_c0_g1_i3::g.150255::m.150255